MHLFIVLMSTGMAALAIAVALIPLWLGALVQAAVAIFSKGRAARFVPLAFGVIGRSASVYTFCISDRVFPWWGGAVYWLIYALLLWAADSLACRIRAWFSARRSLRG